MVHRQSVACIFILGSLQSEISSSEQYQKLAVSCGRFTPQIALRGNEAIFLEVGRSLHLFSERTIRDRILVLAKRFDLRVRVAFATNPCLSLAKVFFLDFEKTESFAFLPIEAAFCFLDPFDTQMSIVKWIETLKIFGVNTMQDFLKIPIESLGTRFGQTAVQVYASLKGEFTCVWRNFNPPRLVEESLQFGGEELESGNVNLELILFSLKTLIDRAMTRLRGLNQRASRVRVEFGLVSWSVVKNPIRVYEISLPVSQGTSIGILPILRDFLYFQISKEPFLAPLRSLKFKVLQTVPGHGLQSDFFSSKEVEKEAADQLLGRLMSHLGNESVFTVNLVDSYCPEKSWNPARICTKKFFSEESKFIEQNQSALIRPSRVLKNPQPVQVCIRGTGVLGHKILVVDEVFCFRPGLVLRSGRKYWEVKSWDGPERILTQWWVNQPEDQVSRDYFQILTQEGEKLWIFFDRRFSPAQGFIHGYFD